ncbi:hypothetical protein D3C84_579790 [compost metagenome]
MHPASQFVEVQLANVLPAGAVRTDQQTPGIDVAEAWQQACQQAFASAGGADERDDFAGLHGQRAVMKNVQAATRCADVDVFQFQPQRRVGQGCVAAADRCRLVQQLPDPFGAGACVGEGLHHPANAFDAEHQGGGDQQRGHQFTDAQLRGGHQVRAVHQNPHMPQRDDRLRQRNPRTGIGEGLAGMLGEHRHLPGETLDAAVFQAKRFDHPHAADAFAEVLIDPVVGLADGAVEADQTLGLAHENPQAEHRQQQRHQPQQRVVPAQQADGGQHHQRGFHHLAPETDQRIAHLVGIAGGAGDHFAHAVLPVITQVQGLHLLQDALAQARQQFLAEHQRQHAGGVLQDATAERHGEHQPQPVPAEAGVETAIGLPDNRAAGADVVDGVADQPLLPDQSEVHRDVQRRHQGEAPGHLPVNRQAAQERMFFDHEKALCGVRTRSRPCRSRLVGDGALGFCMGL